MKSLIIELRSAEGGTHSKILVNDMTAIYRKVAEKNKLNFSILEERSGFTSILIEGKKVKLFQNEAGGHRWQSVSPTDKKGRVHTSTVTVAVLDELKCDYTLDLSEVEYQITRGVGPGGQHKNRTDSCVTAIHKPTGISVKIDSRDQHKNKRLATRLLAERLQEREREKVLKNRAQVRKSQVGCGARGDKRRTYREKDNQIIDHVTGQTWKYKKWIKGQW